MRDPCEHGFPGRARISGGGAEIRTGAPASARRLCRSSGDFPRGGAAARRRVGVGPWRGRGEALGAHGYGGPRHRGGRGRRRSGWRRTKRGQSQRARGLRAPLRRILLSQRDKLGRRRSLRGSSVRTRRPRAIRSRPARTGSRTRFQRVARSTPLCPSPIAIKPRSTTPAAVIARSFATIPPRR